MSRRGVERKELIAFTLDPDIAGLIREIAAKEDRSVSAIIRRIIEDHYNSTDSQTQPASEDRPK